MEEFFKNASVFLYGVVCLNIFLDLFMGKRRKPGLASGILFILQAGLPFIGEIAIRLPGLYLFPYVEDVFVSVFYFVEALTGQVFAELFYELLSLAMNPELLPFRESWGFFGCFAISSGIVIWLYNMARTKRQWNQMQLLREKSERTMQVYHEISADYEEQKRILHDYKNQIGCIRGLLKEGNYQEAGTYADKLADTISDWPRCVNVNNPVINAVLNEKYYMADTKDISIILHANDLSGLWLEEQDIVSILSNLLDNAIEACEKIEKKRVIQVKIIRERRQLVLSVRNPVSEPVSIENGQIRTGKEDKTKHGIGLKNVYLILEKYEGMGMMRYEDGCFYYTAVIPEPD